MKRIAGLLILTSFVSCGKIGDVLYKNDEPERKSTHADFKPYIQALEKDLGEIRVPIVYGNAAADENWVGLCTKWRRSSYREITIDRDYWNKSSDLARYQLLLHEIGHCKFDRDHNEAYNGNCPESVMKSYMFSSSELERCFDPEFDYYVHEIKL